MTIDQNHRHAQTRVILAQLANEEMSLREQAEYLRSENCDFCLKIGASQELERIIKLVYGAGVKITVDENTTERDVEAMEHAIRLLKNNIVLAIKGENK